jgi:hypothetical protein
VNSAAVLTVDGKEISYKDALDFSKQLSTSTQVRRCFVVNWMRYAYEHQETSADDALIDALTAKLTDGTYSVQSLILDLTQTRSFVYRPGDGS